VIGAAYATSPLRVLTPRNHGRAAWAYTSTLGGGMVDGDAIRLRVEVAPGAAAVLASQGQNRVYRSVHGCRSELAAEVGEGAFLALLPDPTVCFAGASYRQKTELRLAAGAEAGPELLFVESGGDNLAAQYSRELADYTIYVIDVAGGDKVPRKGGPGITQSDLLVINKTDLAPQVGADLAVMARDARRMRGDGPVVFAQCTHGVGIAEVVAAVLAARSAALGADSLEGDALRPAPGRIHDP